jgi:putative MATE family efflux protein
MKLEPSRTSLLSLAIPIFAENVIRTSLMAVDQLMLYANSAASAAAMSSVNQLAFFIQLMYMLVSVGASILIAQNLGAGRRSEADRYALASIAAIAVLAVFVSVAVAVAAPVVVSWFALEDVVRRGAVSFLSIYGAGSIFMALNIGQAAILRAYGHPRDPLVVNTIALGLTVAGNAVALFGPFGLPVFGIAGVAVSTVFSQAVACLLSGWAIRRRRGEIELRWREVFRLPRRVFANILAVGLPVVGENLSYNVSQIVIVSFIARLGTASLAAYGLVLTLSRYVFISAISIGSATQLKVGYLVGAGRYDEAYRSVIRYFFAGAAITVAAIIALNLAKGPVIALFTDDPAIASLAAAVLLVGLFLEPARSFNTIINPALKGAGDVRFPVLIALALMWGIGVAGSWLFGIRLAWGLAGVWFAMGCDEWLRGLAMALRWRSGAWRSKRLAG